MATAVAANGEDGAVDTERLSRRTLLKGLAAGAAAAAVPFARPAWGVPPLDRPPGLPPQKLLNPKTLSMWRDPLPIPPELPAAQLHGGTLTMASASHVFHSDLTQTPSATFGYGGASYLGPVIRARRGEPLTFTAYNDLGPHPLAIDRSLHGPDHHHDAEHPRASVHLHGGYTEEASDGYPEDTFVPGESHPYHYDNDQQAGPIWYHDHALGITRLNVYAGLAGLYYLDDEDEHGPVPGGVPRTYGVDDLPLVLQDKAFDRASRQLYHPEEWVPEFFGNASVVNGAILPHLDVGFGVYRFRLANGSSSRFYTLRLTDASVPVWQIATDTGYLPAPVPVRTVILAPGERVELVVDLSRARAGSLYLQDTRLPRPAVSPAPGHLGNVLELRVGAVPANTAGPFDPATYRGPAITALPTAGVPTRYLTLVEIMDPATGAPALSLLNNRLWSTDDLERPTVDTVEVWEILNLTADTHPIHLHLVQFQLLARIGFDAAAYALRTYGTADFMMGDENTGPFPLPPPLPSDYLGAPIPPPPGERGWKDTIQAHPGQATRIAVPFGGAAAPGVPFGATAKHTGLYVWHCHILDHEDNEMMLPYVVEPA
jgi:spore coat protein A, manganese oxidase